MMKIFGTALRALFNATSKNSNHTALQHVQIAKDGGKLAITATSGPILTRVVWRKTEDNPTPNSIGYLHRSQASRIKNMDHLDIDDDKLTTGETTLQMLQTMGEYPKNINPLIDTFLSEPGIEIRINPKLMINLMKALEPFSDDIEESIIMHISNDPNGEIVFRNTRQTDSDTDFIGVLCPMRSNPVNSKSIQVDELNELKKRLTIKTDQ